MKARGSLQLRRLSIYLCVCSMMILYADQSQSRAARRRASSCARVARRALGALRAVCKYVDNLSTNLRAAGSSASGCSSAASSPDAAAALEKFRCVKVANKFADSKVGGLGAGGLSLLAAASFGELLPPLEATTAAAVTLRSLCGLGDEFEEADGDEMLFGDLAKETDEKPTVVLFDFANSRFFTSEAAAKSQGALAFFIEDCKNGNNGEGTSFAVLAAPEDEEEDMSGGGVV